MIIKSHEVPNTYNLIAAVSNWLFLAGFVFFPGTFTSLSHTSALADSAGRAVQHAVDNIPLLCIGVLSSLLGETGICWVWWNLRDNNIWLIDRVFLLSIFNSVIALVLITAIVTVCIIGVCVTVMGSMLLIYELWFLSKLRQLP
ncbi:hypothetical protein B0J13DRAFT_584261 [Dactylonectria estremocensis]|uniref:Uncharacterized protein n=1 Tax=Dactylonectria estremocensis TaxID=1079267 RepID=A0A9P9J2T5_9HYPO|nr:hypothetical protein B0J13DRAFT_584261 [Dactylonectria estremocensis]